jgi:hypothetical protein
MCRTELGGGGCLESGLSVEALIFKPKRDSSRIKVLYPQKKPTILVACKNTPCSLAEKTDNMGGRKKHTLFFGLPSILQLVNVLNYTNCVGNLLCGRPVGQMWSGGGLLLVVCFHRVHPLQ